MTSTARKTYQLGNTTFVLPLRSTGCFVNDSRGHTVAECQSAQAAKQLAETLNIVANNS